MKDNYSIVSSDFEMTKVKNGFKLSNSEKDEERSVAASSFHYKQRIDSMFDDTRSMISDVSQSKHNYYSSYMQEEKENCEDKAVSQRKSQITNEVQNRINKMFIEMNSGESDHSVEVSKFPKFPVAYMGSIPLREKVTSLRELQGPLKELYFNYIRNGRTNSLVHGSLEITRSGLKVKNYGNNVNRSSERLNPFSSIAVWAAVKFVFRKKDAYVINKSEQTEYAFMPLIADPESVDKVSLYQNLSSSESNLLTEGDNQDNPPLFIVVMRESSLVNDFDCHGFICSSSNDAIILAANLYTALVQAIPSQPAPNSNYSEAREIEYPMKLKEFESKYNSCNSAAQSQMRNFSDEIASNENLRKPPRKQKFHCSSESCSNHSSEDVSRASYPKNKMVKKQVSRSNNSNNISKNTITSADIYFENNESMTSLARTRSKQSLQTGKNKSESDGGDILTKVAIPRSKSFLNAGGPFFSRYTKGQDGLGDASDIPNQRKTDVVSPLGLNELFQEFKQEGLYSMNDILDAIIDPDGMSFNDLKPIYKEFVLKLALTLTKDELYQRSKSIMHKQKHKKRQLDRRENIKKSFITGNVLKKALRRSVTNLKYSKYKNNSLEFTSVLFSSTSSDYMRKRSTYTDRQISISAMSSLSSSRSKRSSRKQNHSISSQSRKSSKSSQPKNSRNKKKGSCESIRDKDGKKSYLHHSSSGYISCSECSYSSDSCTCCSAEKCYCSLYTIKNSRALVQGQKMHSILPCDCDTDSCFESDKCYCNQSSLESCPDKYVRGVNGKPSLEEKNKEAYVKRQSGHPLSNDRERKYSDAQTLNGSDHSGLGESKMWPSKTSERSVNNREDQGRRENRINGYSEYNSESRRNKKSSSFVDLKNSKSKMKFEDNRSEKKVLVVSARDPSGKVVYMGQTRAKSMPQNLDAISATDDALCVKKTAEIAALFSSSNEHLMYNTLEPPDKFNEKYFKSNYVETNLESSLGYLP